MPTLPSGPLVVAESKNTKEPFLKPACDNDIKEENDMTLAPWRRYYARFMLAWAVLSHVSLLLQGIHIYSVKSSKGVSLTAFIIYAVSSLIWLVYGLFVLKKRNLVIVISAVTAVALGIFIIIGIMSFSDEDDEADKAQKRSLTPFK